jgi:hypothetical protein
MNNTNISDELKTAYKQAKYVVQTEDKDIILRIGEHNIELDYLLTKHGNDMAAFITPENPYSKPLSEKQNAIRHNDFLDDFKKEELLFIEGYGCDDADAWAKEKSYLVFITNIKTAQNLASKYGQNAWVFCKKLKPIELIYG